AANALRGLMDAAEYLPTVRCATRQAGEHVVLGLIFLKYTWGAFEAHHLPSLKWQIEELLKRLEEQGYGG
ncbi:MAG: hypothetical protein ACP5ON_00540, partial [Bacteroidota bacterium]